MARQQKKVVDDSPYRSCIPPIHRSTDKARKLARRRRSRAKRIQRLRLQGSPEWVSRFRLYASREADESRLALDYLFNEDRGSKVMWDRLKRKQVMFAEKVSALTTP